MRMCHEKRLNVTGEQTITVMSEATNYQVSLYGTGSVAIYFKVDSFDVEEPLEDGNITLSSTESKTVRIENVSLSAIILKPTSNADAYSAVVAGIS